MTLTIIALVLSVVVAAVEFVILLRLRKIKRTHVPDIGAIENEW